MWILFTVFAVLWVLSIEYSLPSIWTLVCFVAALSAAAYALVPKRRHIPAHERVSFERISRY